MRLPILPDWTVKSRERPGHHRAVPESRSRRRLRLARLGSERLTAARAAERLALGGVVLPRRADPDPDTPARASARDRLVDATQGRRPVGWLPQRRCASRLLRIACRSLSREASGVCPVWRRCVVDAVVEMARPVQGIKDGPGCLPPLTTRVRKSGVIPNVASFRQQRAQPSDGAKQVLANGRLAQPCQGAHFLRRVPLIMAQHKDQALTCG